MRPWAATLGLALMLPAPAAAQTGESHLRICRGGEAEDRQMCEMARRRFPGELQKALTGDYIAQRNVAHMLSGGIRPVEAQGVIPNPQEACAWRVVIIRSGHQQSGLGDAHNAVIDCGRLGVNDVRAEARAGELQALIGRRR